MTRNAQTILPSMTNREFCIARRSAELPAFLRVLRALPEARLDFRPDAKSKNAAELAGVLIDEEATLSVLIEAGTTGFKRQPPFTRVPAPNPPSCAS